MSKKLVFSHEIVICTNRDKETLYQSIDTVLQAGCSDQINITVVINGQNHDEMQETRESLEKTYKSRITVVYSKPGLVSARNVALIGSKSDLVTFIDDDFLVPKDYFLLADEAFHLDSDLSGVAPRIAGLYGGVDLKKNPRHKFGKITSSGENFWVPDKLEYRDTYVEWLPGCCMTYRMNKIKGMTFSQALQNGPSKGYSLGEDVDFSMRVGKIRALLSTTGIHLQAPSVRDSSFLMAAARGRWLFYLKTNNRKVKTKNIIFVQLARFIYFLFRSVFQPSIYFRLAWTSIFTLKSFAQEWFHPNLIDGIYNE